MFYRFTPPRELFPRSLQLKLFGPLLLVAACCGVPYEVSAQTLTRELNVSADAPEITVKNGSGRVTIVAGDEGRKSVSLQANSPGKAVSDRDVQTENKGQRVSIEVRPRA